MRSQGSDDRWHHTQPSVAGGTSRRDDAGVAMILVVGVTVILFLLTTTLLVVSGYLTTATQAEESRLKSVHIADAGLNAYLYELRRDPLYYVGHPVLGPTDQDDGRWIVRATAPDPHSQTPLTLRAEGRLVGSSVSSVTT